MRVGLVYNQKPGAALSRGLPSDYYAEWDDNKTINAIRDALAQRHEVLCLDAGRPDIARRIAAERPDIVFNIAEGLSGPRREAEIPALLDQMNIPYTGSNPSTLCLCLDKALTKRFLQSRGLPTPRFHLLPPGSEPFFDTYPAIVKPNLEGSSKGIRDSSVVQDGLGLTRELQRIWQDYSQPALVEEFLSGREFTVGMVGNGDGLRMLPIVEIKLDCLPAEAARIFSYEAKWIWDRPENPLPILQCPANIAEALAERIAGFSHRIFNALGCRDWCRIDFRTDAEGEPYVLEVNPLPGVLPDPRDNSCLPRAAAAAGLSYAELIHKVLDAACKRNGLVPALL